MKRSTEGAQLDVYNEGDLGYLAQLFYRLIYNKANPASSSEPVQVQESSGQLATNETKKLEQSDPLIVPVSTANQTVDSAKVNESLEDSNELEMLASDLSDSEELEIESAFEKLTTILQSDSPEDLKRLLEELTMINMTDVGGQPAFLDMLPALTIGPALYFLFFRLDQELSKHYPVRFHAADSENEVTLESSYCIEEVLYQCLASIACFSRHQSAEMATKRQASSHALLFGTYKDCVDDSQISQIEKVMEERFKGTRLHREGLLLKSLHGKMVITIDNMFGTDESEMSNIRKDIEGIIKSYFPAIPIPVSWLMFRIVLQLLNKPVVSLAQCEKIAKRLSMPSAVQEALWFFHHDIGSLMHYPNLPSMEDVVICNPQVIFDSISKVIIDKFTHGNRALKPGEIDEFQQKGLFTLSHIEDKTEHQQSSLLKLKQLVDLLKHLNILAEVKQDQEEDKDNESEPKFIMPAVIKYASEDELDTPSSFSESQVSPLIIHFEIGFVPFGVFSGGMAHLIAHQASFLPKWKLCDDQVRRNKVKFIIDDAFVTTLISQPRYIMVHIEQHPKARCKSTPEAICSAVRKTIVGTLETVISKMKYKPYESLLVSAEQPFQLAFTCCLEDSHSDHFMTVAKDDSGYHAVCLKSQIALDLNRTNLIWFKVRMLRKLGTY